MCIRAWRKRKRFLDTVDELKVFISKFNYVDHVSIEKLKVLTKNIKGYFVEVHREKDIKKLWDGGLWQTTEQLILLSNDLEKKYNAQLVQLNKNKTFDALIKELEQKGKALDLGV